MSSYNEHHQSRRLFESGSVSGIAEALGTTEWRLFVWLENARALGISVELLPLLAAAREQLALAPSHNAAATGLKLDRLVLTPDGVEPVEVVEAFEHARLDRHWEAALLALAGDERPLSRFEGLTVAGVALAGKSLHLETLAEGIDEPAQLRSLERELCDQGQGFLFARPLAADAVEAFLSAPAAADPHALTVRGGRRKRAVMIGSDIKLDVST